MTSMSTKRGKKKKGRPQNTNITDGIKKNS
jgi:hypothetical protein